MVDDWLHDNGAEENGGRPTEYVTADEEAEATPGPTPASPSGAAPAPLGGGDTPRGPGLGVVLKALEEVNSRLEGATAPPPPPPPRPDGGLHAASSGSVLAAASALVGPPPRTGGGGLRPQRPPGGSKKGLGSGRAEAELDDEEDESPQRPAATATEQALQYLLSRQVAELKKAQQRNEGISGLLSDDSDAIHKDSLGRLPGAKGALAGGKLRKAMQKHPEAFSARMDANVVAALEEDQLTSRVISHSLMRYAQECIPVGGQRTLGDMVAAMAQIRSSLIKGDVARARMLSVGSLVMTEQSALDGNWKTAWRLMGLQQPPWHEWSTMDVFAVRKEYSESRLADNKRFAAVIAGLKDEDFLVKRRVQGGNGVGKGRKEGDGA